MLGEADGEIYTTSTVHCLPTHASFFSHSKLHLSHLVGLFTVTSRSIGHLRPMSESSVAACPTSCPSPFENDECEERSLLLSIWWMGAIFWGEETSDWKQGFPLLCHVGFDLTSFKEWLRLYHVIKEEAELGHSVSRLRALELQAALHVISTAKWSLHSSEKSNLSLQWQPTVRERNVQGGWGVLEIQKKAGGEKEKVWFLWPDGGNSYSPIFSALRQKKSTLI